MEKIHKRNHEHQHSDYRCKSNRSSGEMANLILSADITWEINKAVCNKGTIFAWLLFIPRAGMIIKQQKQFDIQEYFTNH